MRVSRCFFPEPHEQWAGARAGGLDSRGSPAGALPYSAPQVCVWQCGGEIMVKASAATRAWGRRPRVRLLLGCHYSKEGS